MGSLIKLVARAMRRYGRDTMLILADLCEERELHEVARKLRATTLHVKTELGALTAFIALYNLRNMIRPKRKMGDAMIRYNMWIGEHKWSVRQTQYGPEKIRQMYNDHLIGATEAGRLLGVTPLPPYRSGPRLPNDQLATSSPGHVCARCDATSTNELLHQDIADRYVCRHEADCNARMINAANRR